MVPAVLISTTNTLFRKYCPMCASFQASAYVLNEKCSGIANGLPRRISVLCLNEASSTQISGPAVASAHRNRAMCATPLSGLSFRCFAAAGVDVAAAVDGLDFRSVIVTLRGSGVDGVATGDPQGQRGERKGQE